MLIYSRTVTGDAILNKDGKDQQNVVTYHYKTPRITQYFPLPAQ